MKCIGLGIEDGDNGEMHFVAKQNWKATRLDWRVMADGKFGVDLEC
jgi:hypothetical protein